MSKNYMFVASLALCAGIKAGIANNQIPPSNLSQSAPQTSPHMPQGNAQHNIPQSSLPASLPNSTLAPGSSQQERLSNYPQSQSSRYQEGIPPINVAASQPPMIKPTPLLQTMQKTIEEINSKHAKANEEVNTLITDQGSAIEKASSSEKNKIKTDIIQEIANQTDELKKASEALAKDLVNINNTSPISEVKWGQIKTSIRRIHRAATILDGANILMSFANK